MLFVIAIIFKSVANSPACILSLIFALPSCPFRPTVDRQVSQRTSEELVREVREELRREIAEIREEMRRLDTELDSVNQTQDGGISQLQTRLKTLEERLDNANRTMSNHQSELVQLANKIDDTKKSPPSIDDNNSATSLCGCCVLIPVALASFVTSLILWVLY